MELIRAIREGQVGDVIDLMPTLLELPYRAKKDHAEGIAVLARDGPRGGDLRVQGAEQVADHPAAADGHRAGDALLVQYARRVEGLLRQTDTLARLAHPRTGDAQVQVRDARALEPAGLEFCEPCACGVVRKARRSARKGTRSQRDSNDVEIRGL